MFDAHFRRHPEKGKFWLLTEPLFLSSIDFKYVTYAL